MRDFYFRDDEDPLYDPEALEVADERELLVMQIKMILLTNHGEVLGAYKFGGNIWNFLFDFQLNPDGMTSFLVNQIKTYSEIARGYNLDLSIKRIPDERFRDAGIIDVKLNGKSYFGIVI